jgi:hypothetical protein
MQGAARRSKPRAEYVRPDGSSVRTLRSRLKMDYYSFMMNEHRSELLEHMGRDRFLKSVQRAEREADEANQSRKTLELWAKRLMPYFDADPDLSMAEAIDKYKFEHGLPGSERT